MTPQQLEAAVLAATDQVRGQGSVEDDRIEVKREWPDPEKPRQLAGAANRARGSDLIYIIGMDERTGVVYPLGGQDPASWWAQMAKRFEEVAPDLVQHLNVQIGEGEVVAALLFATDRAPYVVKTAGGSPELEVPIRDGTRTRSARRHELLRMLVPVVALPPAAILAARVSGGWRSEPPGADAQRAKAATSLRGEARIFIEHGGRDAVMLPAHQMTGELAGGGHRFKLDLFADAPRDNRSRPVSAFGVSVLGDGVVVTGPGSFATYMTVTPSPLGDVTEALAAVAGWDLILEFGVVGASQPIRVQASLLHVSPRRRSDTENAKSLPEWSTAPDGP